MTLEPNEFFNELEELENRVNKTKAETTISDTEFGLDPIANPIESLNSGSGLFSSFTSDPYAQIEAILFATPNPIKIYEILELLQDNTLTSRKVEEIITEIMTFHSNRTGGFRLVYLKGLGYQFQTIPEMSFLMEKMFSNRPRPLSRAAQETLAIIAFRQPVTRADIEFIRGVDAGSIIKNLLERNLITVTGRKEDIGRPMLFGTTEEFLRVYGLSSLADLPPLDAFQPSQDMVSKALEKIGGEQIPDPNEMMTPPETASEYSEPISE